MSDSYISVSQLNTYIRNIFEAEIMLQNICVYGEVSSYNISNGIAYFNLKDETHKYYLVEEVIIPQSITRIGDYAFCGSIGINEVFLHDNVESIGLQAFLGCRINEVFIPKSVVEIKDSFVSSSQSITLRCEVSQMPEGWIIQRNNIVLYNQTRK